jgi:predicted fused transcriptional regulator/phosphomethylpyrimidine kinase
MVEEAIFIKLDETVFLKQAIAQALYRRNIEQSKISDLLNLSQPMVSNYCSSNEEIPNNILNIAEKISDRIIKIPKVNFLTCISFSDNPIEGNYFIASKNELISDENNKIINNLTEAFFLLKGKDIGHLLPEVKVNIAMAKEKAVNQNDVAAFLNGLIIADDKITGYNGIRFGRSKHLSSLLIYLKKMINVNAVMNVAFILNIKKIGLSCGYLTKDFKLNDSEKNFDILLHKGDFGIEPCAYILGKDAVDVVNKAIKLKEEIK